MSAPTIADSEIAKRQWFIVGRWEDYEGEGRVNLLRTIGVGAFYSIELLNYYGVQLGSLEWPVVVDTPFHQTVTALCVAWALVALGTLVCLRQGIFPPALKYITTSADILLLTGILMVADGPRSPLVIGYFLVIALSALRFQLGLVWFGSLGAMAAYIVLLGYARWFAGREESLLGPRDITVPRYHQLIFLVGLALCGIVLGQLIRRVKAMAAEFARRLAAAHPTEPAPNYRLTRKWRR
jgi:hypothetical protein